MRAVPPVEINSTPASASTCAKGTSPVLSKTERSARWTSAMLKLPAVNGVAPKRLLDSQQLVVLGHAIRAAERARLDLAGVRRHCDVRDCCILGFARAMADHRRVIIFL